MDQVNEVLATAQTTVEGWAADPMGNLWSIAGVGLVGFVVVMKLTDMFSEGASAQPMESFPATKPPPGLKKAAAAKTPTKAAQGSVKAVTPGTRASTRKRTQTEKFEVVH